MLVYVATYLRSLLIATAVSLVLPYFSEPISMGAMRSFFINSASVVEDISYDSLRAFHSRFFKGCTCSGFIEVLDLGDVRNFGVNMGQDLRILGGGWLYLVRTLVM